VLVSRSPLATGVKFLPFVSTNRAVVRPRFLSMTYEWVIVPALPNLGRGSEKYLCRTPSTSVPQGFAYSKRLSCHRLRTRPAEPTLLSGRFPVISPRYSDKVPLSISVPIFIAYQCPCRDSNPDAPKNLRVSVAVV